MMKGLAITGNEDVSLLEITEIIGEKAKKEKNAVIFSADPEKLCDLCYFGRSFRRVMELLCSFSFKNIDDIKEKIKIRDFEAGSFRAKCIREGEHDFNSSDVEKIIGNKVNLKVDLKNPEKTLLVYINANKFYLGVEYSGFDLGKRSYRIFPHPAAIRGDAAYALLRLSGYGKNRVLVDPFCGSGTICIEAALFSSNKSVHFHDKEKFAFNKFLKYEFRDEPKESKNVFGTDFSQNAIIAAKKNAKIAGADAEFTKADVDWLDTKFGDKSVDLIVTNPPQISKKRKNANVLKAYNDLFANAKNILRDNGTVSVISRNYDEIIKAAEKSGFGARTKTEISNCPVIIFSQ